MVKKRIVASIEARLNSSRLPGKVLKTIHGKPSIELLIDRLRLSKNIDEIIIATTNSKLDDDLINWCEHYQVKYYRGSENDVLGRVVEAHKECETDIVVSLTGDCPFTDPEVVDLGIETFLSNDCDYLTNCEIESFPQGICVQVFRYSDLIYIEKNYSDPVVREHVTVPFYEDKSKYRNINLIALDKLKLKTKCRTQLDYPEDLDFLNKVASTLIPRFGYGFSTQEFVEFIKNNSELLEINKHCIEKEIR